VTELRLRRDATLLALLLILLAGCGHASRSPLPTAALPAPAVNPAAADGSGDWYSQVLLHRDMNAAAADRHFATVRVKPQQQVDFALLGGKGVSSLQGLPQLLPAPSTLHGAPAGRHSSDFTPDDLIKDGSGFDPSLPQALATPGDSSDPVVALASNTDPYTPQTSGAAYATFRFSLQNYAGSGQPQSIGTLWDQDDAPTTYFVGLSDWAGDRWAWFEGENDNVVTVDSLAPYINPADNSLLAVVLVLDDTTRHLRLAQVGAKELRGFGGVAPDTDAGQDITGPDDYYDGKGTSSVNGVPAAFLLDETKFGGVYDQGQTDTCTCCAASAMANYEIATAYAPYWQSDYAKRHMSPKWIYKETLLGQCWAGRPPETVLDFLKNTGPATEKTAPWNENCNVDYTKANCQAEGAKLKIAGWRKIGTKGQGAIEEVKNHLVNLNHPVLILMTVTDDLLDADPWAPNRVYHWSGVTANLLNWHSMTIIGYDDAKQAFRVRNSWGREWGDDGDFWLGYDCFTSNAWIDLFAMWTNYSAATASYFNLTQDAAVPPDYVGASTSYQDKINVVWNPVPLATGYRIYRDKTTNLIATIPDGATNSYDDTAVGDFLGHTYWVQSVVGSSTSKLGSSGYGYRTKPAAPTILEVRTTGYGTQGDSLAFYPVVQNPDGSALTFSWSFPASSIVEASPIPQRSPTVTLGQPGGYTGTLTVTNAGGQTQQDFLFDVLATKPVAAFGTTDPLLRSKVVYFDASASTAAPGHSVANYSWDWNGDYIPDYTGDISQFAHIFTAAGANKLSLRVTDDRGVASDWVDHTFNIEIPWAKGGDPAPFDVGWYNSLAVVGGNPAISYSSSSALKYVSAKDAGGIAWNAPVVVDDAGSGQTGLDTSLAVIDGNPAISYWDYTDNKLRYVRATAASGRSTPSRRSRSTTARTSRSCTSRRPMPTGPPGARCTRSTRRRTSARRASRSYTSGRRRPSPTAPTAN
jgi:C1A family cysteine protease